MSCKQTADIYIGYPVIEVFDYLSRLPAISGFKVSFVDSANYRIYMSAGIGFTSWGEDISISFFDPMDGGTRVIIESKSKLPTTLIDYGKNKKNVTSVSNYILGLYNVR